VKAGPRNFLGSASLNAQKAPAVASILAWRILAVSRIVAFTRCVAWIASATLAWGTGGRAAGRDPFFELLNLKTRFFFATIHARVHGFSFNADRFDLNCREGFSDRA
jgi:hypothetical protein